MRNATLTNGIVSIPEQTFLDARLYPVGGSAGQFISSIVKTASSIELIISDEVSGVLAHGEVIIADILTESIS